MKNVTPFPDPAKRTAVDVVVLSCPHLLHFNPDPLTQLFAEKDLHEAEDIVCRMLEDIAMRLDLLQHGLAHQDFKAMRRPARRIALVATHIGLTEVSTAASHVLGCLRQTDRIGLDATMARLERGFDVAVSEIWNFRDV